MPLLTKEREIALSDIILKANTTDSEKESAVHELASHNIRLVITEASRISNFCGFENTELVGEGQVGLVEAAWIFDPVKFKARFATHAMYWIRKRMFALLYKGDGVKVPVNIVEKAIKYKRIQESNAQSSFFTDDDWVKHLDVSVSVLNKIRASRVQLISLDKSIEDKGDDSFALFIPDEKSQNPVEFLMKKDEFDELHEVLDGLSDMEKDIVVSQCMDDDKIKLKTLGDKYGKSSERIRQIKEKTLMDLKKKLVKRGNL